MAVVYSNMKSIPPATPRCGRGNRKAHPSLYRLGGVGGGFPTQLFERGCAAEYVTIPRNLDGIPVMAARPIASCRVRLCPPLYRRRGRSALAAKAPASG